MAAKAIDPLESALPLTPAMFHILLALTDGPKHGYAIMSEMAESGPWQLRLGPGTLYGCIKRMVELEWIEEIEEPPTVRDGRAERRRRYRLTALGRRVATAETTRLAQLLSRAPARKLLRGTASS
jgi:DNA-binding PadR family transcriptional regulator